ncbi:hypothetical protein Tco_0403981 [Tanacetum coccineum]
MDDPNITMKEYIRIEEEKAQRHGRTFNWQTATFRKVKNYEDEDDCFIDFETEFPAIVFDNTITSDTTLICASTVSPPNKNKIDFRISLDESDDEDYTMKHHCPNVMKKRNILYFNDIFSFNVIYPDDSKLDEDNDDDKIDMEHSSGDLSVNPLPDVIITDDGAYAHGSNKLLKTSHDTLNKFFKTETFIKKLNVNIMACNYLNNGMLLNLIKNLNNTAYPKDLAETMIWYIQKRTCVELIRAC